MITINGLFNLPGWVKTLLLLWMDMVALTVAFTFAYWIRLGVQPNPIGWQEWQLFLSNTVFTIGAMAILGLYRQVLRYMTAHCIFALVLGLLASMLFLAGAKVIIDAFVPLSVPVMYFTFAFVLMGGPRVLIALASRMQGYHGREKCLIFGAEHAGRALAMALEQGQQLLPVAFIDDKGKFQGKTIMGLPVVSQKGVGKLIEKHGIRKILLAVNNCSASRRKELLTNLESFAVELLTTPDVSEIATGARNIDDLREVRIEELLGREPVPPITELLHRNIAGKQVMVTGAGGSIGSELCRQIALGKPASLVLFELCEFNLYQIEQELRNRFPQLALYPVLASIQDPEAVADAIRGFRIQTIYHAAAYKHVPMVEHNVCAGIRNNVLGTTVVARTAAKLEVEKFVLVSTDKAVRPTNVMGATKRFAELFVQGLAQTQTRTEFAIVRFGNVLGSSGSVVPVFSRQIRSGGPITVTHPDIVRYFMTIPEAAQLVLQAGAMGSHGEVFVLDMGEPVRIVDMARKMAHLMGYTVREGDSETGDIELRYTGLRPGEKLYEELLIADAETQTAHPRIMGANEVRLPFAEINHLIARLHQALGMRNESAAIKILLEAPLAYTPANHEVTAQLKSSVVLADDSDAQKQALNPGGQRVWA